MSRTDDSRPARLFVAVDLDGELRNRVVATARRLADTLQPVAGATPRWVAAENLHLTLRFIGQVALERVAQLQALVGAPLDGAPFRMELGGAGCFPRTGAIRVLWLGVTQGQTELATLAARIDERLRDAGIAPDDRPFRAHLTLARFRRPCAGRAARQVREALATVGSVGDAAVSHVTLYESRLGPAGPSYIAHAQGRFE